MGSGTVFHRLNNKMIKRPGHDMEQETQADIEQDMVHIWDWRPNRKAKQCRTRYAKEQCTRSNMKQDIENPTIEQCQSLRLEGWATTS